MEILPLLVAALVLGQNADPPDEMPYGIYLNSKEKRVFVFVEESEWMKPRMSATLDEPWLPPSERKMSIRKNDIGDDLYREVSSTRARRVERGWIDHGYIRVSTSKGENWVSIDELKLAQLAMDLEASIRSENDTVPEADEQLASDPEVSGATFWDLWGWHIGVVMGASFFASLVIWLGWFY